MSLLADENEMRTRNAAADRYARGHNCMITEQELATVLAALRYWQQDLEANDEPPISEEFFADSEPLTSDEIDGLCERLNCEPEETLSAAAPKLLDALRKCASFIENVTDDDPDREAKFFACRKAWREAIADAEGARP